jgi:hypothetical protein
MAVTIADRFAAQCSVVYSNNYDTCGTITRSSMAYLTPAQLESLFTVGGLFADLDAWFKTAIEMKACGTKTYGMYDWIMSGADRTKGRTLLSVQKTSRGPSLMFPFILGRQDSVINTDFFAITTGGLVGAYAASGNLTTDDLTTGTHFIRVVSRYGVDLDSKWFVDRDRVHIFTRSNGVAQEGQWKVGASAAATDGSSVDLVITSENAGSSGAFKPTPTSGVLLPGVNNVNDFEKWCNNRPNYDGRKEVPFWFQTMRRTRCVDQQYMEYYKRLNEPGVNEAFRQFGDLSLAERNRQDEREYQKRWVNAFFYNKPISANQTLALWGSLEAINSYSGTLIDPGTGGKLIARRANFVGVKEQMLQCDRVRDLQNNPLNYYEWLDENYRIMRARKSQGRSVTDIDWYTDSVTRANMQSAYVAYIKAEYGSVNVQFPMQLGQTNDLGFVWDSFTVKHPAGLRINILSHEFFDDWRDANKTESQESIGINLWCLDLGKSGPNGGTIYWSQIASNRKVHAVGDLEKLAPLDANWACVMENLSQEITLTSETGTAIVECPNNSILLTNIADAVPILTGRTSSYTNLY